MLCVCAFFFICKVDSEIDWYPPNYGGTQGMKKIWSKHYSNSIMVIPTLYQYDHLKYPKYSRFSEYYKVIM